MKLTHSDGTVLNLPDTLLWEDEFNWSPTVSSHDYALDGTLIVEQASKLAGRPISLKAPSNMAWVTRQTLARMKDWAALKNAVFTLQFDYPDDTRTFNVMFDNSSEALSGSPVKGFPSHRQGDWFIADLKFIEVV